jgi:hypothetical protein
MRHGSTIVSTLAVLGLALGGLSSFARSSEPLDDRLGIRTAPIFLLMRPDVQADLRLNASQVSQCTRAAHVFYRRALTLRKKAGQGITAARREIDEQQSEWLQKHLSPEQCVRLEQIDLQWEGPSAMLSRPLLDESLRLTAEQQAKLAECVAEAKSKRAQGSWTHEDHAHQTKKAIALLSEQQKAIWIHLLGPPCQFWLASDGQPQRRPGS